MVNTVVSEWKRGAHSVSQFYEGLRHYLTKQKHSGIVAQTIKKLIVILVSSFDGYELGITVVGRLKRHEHCTKGMERLYEPLTSSKSRNRPS